MEKFDKDQIFVPKNGKTCLMQEFNIWSFAKNVVSDNEWYVRREWRKHRNMLIEEIQKASKQDLSRCLSSLWVCLKSHDTKLLWYVNDKISASINKKSKAVKQRKPQLDKHSKQNFSSFYWL
jgi:hypothetical protein